MRVAEADRPSCRIVRPVCCQPWQVEVDDELFARCFCGQSGLPSHRNGLGAPCVAEPSGIHWQTVFFVITDRCLTDTSACSGVLFSGSCLACLG